MKLPEGQLSYISYKHYKVKQDSVLLLFLLYNFHSGTDLFFLSPVDQADPICLYWLPSSLGSDASEVCRPSLS